MSNNPKSRLHRNRAFLLLVIALFVLPPLLAWLLIGKWQPDGSVEHGRLIHPARPVPAWQGQDLAAEPPESMDELILRGRWTMLHLSTGAQCDSVCETTLYNMRQMKAALGKDMDRTQTLVLFSASPDAQLQDWLRREHGLMLKAVLADDTIPKFMSTVLTNDGFDQGIFLIDPLGNLFMHYENGANPSDILKDFRRLLKYSKIG
jgi:hypothetical protein